MEVLHIILTIIQVLCAIALVAIIMLQQGKNSGLNAMTGGSSETFLSKGKATTKEAKLAKMTKWIALVFIVLTFVLNLF